MRDLSMFAGHTFDVVFNPVSTVFCPDLAPVWRECFRVLRPGGILMSGFLNPDVFIFDVAAMEDRDELVVRHQLPFSTLDLSDDERHRVYGTGPIEYSHSLSAQLGGQLAAGFRLTDLDESPHQADPTGRYMSGYFATRPSTRKPGTARPSAEEVVERRDRDAGGAGVGVDRPTGRQAVRGRRGWPVLRRSGSGWPWRGSGGHGNRSSRPADGPACRSPGCRGRG